MFFCCAICATQFHQLVERIKQETGWSLIEALEIAGDRRGRTCVAQAGAETFRARVTFNPEGGLLRFEKLPPPGGSTSGGSDRTELRQ